MKIHEVKVIHVAKLARLKLTEQEIQKFKKELDSILEYMDMLKEVETSAVEPCVHTYTMTNVMRPDEVKKSQERTYALSNAPISKNGNIIVPKVIE